MQLQYNVFYKQFGIRRIQQILSPRVFDITLFHFPQNSLFHYVPENDEEVGPDERMPYFTGYNKRILVDHVSTLVDNKGAPRRNSTPANTLFRPFHIKHKLFKYMQEPYVTIKDPYSLIVVNYGFLQKLYRYVDFKLTPYFKWVNTEETVWKNVKKIALESDRNQFVFFNLPDVLPGMGSLKAFDHIVNPTLMKVFDTTGRLTILEFWKWLGEKTRDSSTMAGLELEQLNKVNVVILRNNRWCVLNLGYLETLRKSDLNSNDHVNLKFDPAQLQRLFLKLIMGVQSLSTTVETITPTPTGPTSEPTGPEPEVLVDTSDEESDEFSHVEKTMVGISNKKLTDIKAPEITETDDDTVGLSLDQINIDDDLETLDYIDTKSLMLKDIKNTKAVDTKSIDLFSASQEEIDLVNTKVYNVIDTNQELRNQIDQYAEYSLMSASDYRSALKNMDNYEKLKNPYGGDTPLTTFMKVKPEDIALTTKDIQLPDIENVIDKSMLKSSLLSFDSKYVKTVMPKDILAMTANVRRAGFIIQDHTVEQSNTILGDYEAHTLKVKPIDGVASILRFKLPKVNTEGTFTSNGNKYLLRKQRGD